MTKPHALYRFFDATGDLLYVGITHDPGSRWRGHMRDKPWWSQVASITLEEHPDRESVLLAERDAIRTEQPRFNVAHRDKSTPAVRTASVTGQKPMLAVGDVVAVAVQGWKCPVGQVAESDLTSCTLDLYSWLTGHFGAGKLAVPYARVLCLRFAEPFSRAEKERLGWDPKLTVYDMDPLADFQNEWKQPPAALAPAEQARIQSFLVRNR